MEAARFGFGADTPAAFKFDPTDADIVAHYLLPRALGLPTPYAHAVIDDDPSSVPPWELLRRHGHGGSDHAFFLGPSTADAAQNGGRKSRAVKGGTWQGQKSVDGRLILLRPDPGGGGEVDVRYRRYNLTFCRGKRSGSTGFVMHEYVITSPPLPGTVLTRVKVTRKGKDRMKLQQQQAEAEAEAPIAAAAADSDDDQQVLPVPEQPSPSCYYDAVPVPGDDGDTFFSGGQAVARYGHNDGGGMVDTGGYYAPPFYVPEGGGAGEYNNYYCQHQQVLPWPYQLDPSYQYHAAGNAAIVSAGEGFSIWQQTGALDDYGDNSGGGTGETGGHCAAPLCGAGAGDNDCDDNSYYYDALFGDDDIKLEQNDDAGDPATDQE